HRSLTHHDLLFLFFIPPRTPRSTLFPYTTLFRSTTFIVELPILEVKEEPQADRRGAHSSVPEMPRNILVVDDEEVIVELLNEVLSTAGHRVETARSGKQALDKILAAAFDAVISDLKMPGLD